MDPIAVVFAQVLVSVVGAVAALAVIALGTRVVWRLTSRVEPREGSAITQGDFRRLELAIEAMAVEVERISEAQRYTVALLSERTGDAKLDGHAAGAQLPPARTDTPR